MKTLVMLLVASVLCLAVTSCSDDDEKSEVLYKGENGSIVDNGDELVATVSQELEQGIVKLTVKSRVVAKFEDDKCVSMLVTMKVSPALYATILFPLLEDKVEEELGVAPVIEGDTMTLDMTSLAEGQSKSEVVELFKYVIENGSDIVGDY